jgi:hypothetical protein
MKKFSNVAPRTNTNMGKRTKSVNKTTYKSQLTGDKENYSK